MTNRRAWTINQKYCLKFGVLVYLGLNVLIHGILCRKVTIVEIRDDITAPLLSCWTCSHSPESPYNECVHMNNRENVTETVCTIYQPYCKVQLLEDEYRIERLERSCTQECNPGCNRLLSIKKCETCCTQPLCNVGNDAVASQPMLRTALACLVVYTVGNM